MSYKIVRHYLNGRNRTRVIIGHMTLEEAQAYCNDPETSSRTCTKAAGKRRTKVNGPWFDGYTEE